MPGFRSGTILCMSVALNKVVFPEPVAEYSGYPGFLIRQVIGVIFKFTVDPSSDQLVVMKPAMHVEIGEQKDLLLSDH